MTKPGDTIFHLKLKVDGKNHYFGSIAAIYEKFAQSDLGIMQQSLYDYDIDETRPYENKLCVISKSKIVRKKSNRKRPNFNI